MMTSECVATMSWARVRTEYVQVRIRFIKQQHRSGSCVQQRQEHQHLLKAAARAGHVEAGPIRCVPILSDDVGPAAVGRDQYVPKQPPDCVLQAVPGRLGGTRLEEDVPQHFAWASLAEQVVELGPRVDGLLCAQARHGRDEHGGCRDRPQEVGLDRLGPYVDLLAAIGLELHRERPRVGRERDPDIARVVAIAPQEVERPQRYGRERLSRNGRLRVRPAVTVEVVQFLPPLQSQTPRGNRLENGRLAGVVRPCQDDVTGQRELDTVEPLETFDDDSADHRRSCCGNGRTTSSSLPRSSITLTATCLCSPASKGALIVPAR